MFQPPTMVLSVSPESARPRQNVPYPAKITKTMSSCIRCLFYTTSSQIPSVTEKTQETNRTASGAFCLFYRAMTSWRQQQRLMRVRSVKTLHQGEV